MIKSEPLFRAFDHERCAEILAVSVKTVHKLVREAKLARCVRTGNGQREKIHDQQVINYIESRTKTYALTENALWSVSSTPKKGGEQDCKAKSFEAQVNRFPR